MIVRINQIGIAQVEAASGWPPRGPAAEFESTWPVESNAFEMLILDADEAGRPLTPDFRVQQLRAILPDVLDALRDDDELMLVRLDGFAAPGEMLTLFSTVERLLPTSAVAFSALSKPEPDGSPPAWSVRMVLEKSALADICQDTSIGLNRNVRLRALLVPETILSEVFAIDSPADPRWADVLPLCGSMATTTHPLFSVQIISPRLQAQQVRAALTRALVRAPAPALRVPRLA